MEEPLLSARGSESGERESDENWSSYQYVGRRPGSVIPTSSFSDSCPPSLHAALITSPDHYDNKQAIVYQGVIEGNYDGTTSKYGRQILDEVEIRELLIDHVGHHCCWGSRPARTWRIHGVEDCNVYGGTLDTFIEERETVKETEPYVGGNIDGKDKGPELGIWELDLRSQFPVLFVPYQESKVKIPHSEIIEKCSGCAGRREITCSICNVNQEPGFYKENQMMQCPACYGRGLIAHRDGSDTICVKCEGKGRIPCATCGSRGLIKCETCRGTGSLLTRTFAIIKWKTLSTRKVSGTSGATSVPDEVFHRAKGIQLCNTQAYQCAPAFFADSFFLNKFSSEVIAERACVPPTARVICERHTISVVPVTRVTMAHHGRSFRFYIIGNDRGILEGPLSLKILLGTLPLLRMVKVLILQIFFCKTQGLHFSLLPLFIVLCLLLVEVIVFLIFVHRVIHTDVNKGRTIICFIEFLFLVLGLSWAAPVIFVVI